MSTYLITSLPSKEVGDEVKELHDLEVERPAKQKMGRRWKALLAALGGLTGAAITFITTFGWVSWSAAQTTLVVTEAAAVLALLTAAVAHFYPDTPREPVALASTFTAVLTATLALGSGFSWWSFTQQEVSALAALVVAIFGVGGALFARDRVFANLATKKPGST
jgi:drug/metabolite transporter (DMT)-like permease